MTLSELIDKAQKAKEKHGDMVVFALVNYDKKCDKCKQSEAHNKSGKVYSVDAYGGVDNSGDTEWHFLIDAVEE